jgi:hypothetical protein
MDLGQIIYIIAVIGYFLYQASKKKRSTDPMETDEKQSDTPQKGLTFEELLKEIRNSQNPPVPELPKEVKQEPLRPVPVPVSVDSTSSKNQRKKQVEPKEDIDDEASYYEGAFGHRVKQNPYQAYANKLVEEPERSAFKFNEVSSKKVNPYAALLKNPKSLKEAVIVSEILRPKYF